MSGTSKLGSWESRKTTIVLYERLFSCDLPSCNTLIGKIKEKYAHRWYPRCPPICPLNPVLLGQFQLGHRLPSNNTEANDLEHLVQLDLQAAHNLSTMALALEQTSSTMVPTNFIPDDKP